MQVNSITVALFCEVEVYLAEQIRSVLSIDSTSKECQFEYNNMLVILLMSQMTKNTIMGSSRENSTSDCH